MMATGNVVIEQALPRCTSSKYIRELQIQVMLMEMKQL